MNSSPMRPIACLLVMAGMALCTREAETPDARPSAVQQSGAGTQRAALLRQQLQETRTKMAQMTSKMEWLEEQLKGAEHSAPEDQGERANAGRRLLGGKKKPLDFECDGDLMGMIRTYDLPANSTTNITNST